MTPEQRAQIKSADSAWYVRRLRLNNGGYTSSGTYYGLGAPLYECFNAREYLVLRASDRQDAIAQLRNHIPHKIVIWRP